MNRFYIRCAESRRIVWQGYARAWPDACYRPLRELPPGSYEVVRRVQHSCSYVVLGAFVVPLPEE